MNTSDLQDIHRTKRRSYYAVGMATDLTRPPRLDQTLLLSSGHCVRLRLVHFSDLDPVADLIRRHGEPSGQLSAERLVQFDPRRRYVVCAMALIDGAERLVGLGTVDLVSGPGEPETLICEPDIGQELPDLLRQVLCAAAQAGIRARAA